VLGAFATYYREPRSPTPQERNVIEQITQLVSIAVERERAEEVLREQARLLDLTHDTVFVRDMSHVIDYWNRGAEDLYGWKREEACGKVSHQLMQTAFPAPLDEINAELLRTGHWEGELVNQKRDGTRIVVASSWSLRRDKQGQPAAILETNKDISERKRAEAELRESEEQWKNVFDNNPTMYFIIDAAGTVLLVNPFGAEQLGYQVDELVGQPVLSVFPEPDREPLQRNVAGCLEQLGRSRSWEARKVRKDGKVLWVRETAKAVSRVSGPIVLIACEDITEQKRAEEALRQAQADLAHVSRVTTMGELTASLAHEVNQPIAAAVTNANACLRWLAGDIPNLEEARAAATRIVKDGTRAAEIISRTRLLFKKGTPQQELVDVNEVIREMIVLLRNETTRYSIAVRTELAADLPQVMGDRVQLQQVIMNLIMNSIDAMKEVEGTRELAINSQRAKDEQLLVSVSDTGVGLPPQQADHIFNAFFTTKLHGTGMGLSISRSIVESHGGRLWAADNPPRGASLSLTLPAAVADLPGRTSRRGAA
jgi:PAS domain S-box-containing protein